MVDPSVDLVDSEVYARFLKASRSKNTAVPLVLGRGRYGQHERQDTTNKRSFTNLRGMLICRATVR